ncbi:MAG: hypothetical protein Q8Q08_03155 [Candidatus Omnitrophota bacterium]|nr:hypothetical protein [Candidatus Omnitrophota bacterium]MDZ4241459.1 hypothetical protein [Candidatus Omnitrophota bacterium]
MRYLMLTVVLLAAAGCASGTERLQTIMDDPSAILADPDFAQYQEQSDALESRYLRKDITYAEYLERKKQLDEQYAGHVQKQRETVENPDVRSQP